MNQALLRFSNGDSLELHEGQMITPISKFTDENGTRVSKCPQYEVWSHINDGLMPSIAELLCSCDFFHPADKNNKIFNSSAVVTVETF